MYYYAGCDIGSTTGKAVILDENENIISTAIIKSKIDPGDTGQIVLEKALEKIDTLSSINDLTYIIGTGYGRNEVPFANGNISEITCHAMGTFFINPEVKTIIDIGGQDVKAIGLNPNGKVREFAMNDKCAAGTGRFFEMMCNIFDMNLEEFSDLSLKSGKVVPITSQCSVFAESEVISLISKRNKPEDIAAGIQQSVAKRIFTLARKTGLIPRVAVTGGCSKNIGLIETLKKVLRVEIEPLPFDGQLIGALGAAVLAKKNHLAQ